MMMRLLKYLIENVTEGYLGHEEKSCILYYICTMTLLKGSSILSTSLGSQI